MGGRSSAPPPPPPRREVPQRVSFTDVELPERKKARRPTAAQRGIVRNGNRQEEQQTRQTLG